MDEVLSDVNATATPATNVPLTLEQHEGNSAHRAARIEKRIKHLKEEMKMSTTVPDVNVFGSGLGMGNAGMGGAIGGGLGAGLLGGVLGGALLNNGGLFGGRREGGEWVTPTQLTAAVDGAVDTLQNTAVMQTLGDIKAAVPLAESQVQLALAGAQADIITNQSVTATAQALANQLTNQNIANATASIIATESALKDTVTNYGVANLSAIKDSIANADKNSWAITQAINNDGDKTRALISSIDRDNLNRQLAVAEAALLSVCNATLRARETEVNVTQTVNQNQLQAQSQAQAQQQTLLLSQLVNGFGGIANQLNNVHQGIVQIGTGNAAVPTTTNTNVR